LLYDIHHGLKGDLSHCNIFIIIRSIAFVVEQKMVKNIIKDSY